MAVLDYRRLRHLKRDQNTCSSSALVVDTVLQQTKIIIHSKIYLLVSIMGPFHCYAWKKSKKLKIKTEIRKKRLLINVERRFSPADIAFSNQGVPVQYALKNTPQLTRIWKEWYRSSARELEIISFDGLKVRSTSKRRVSTDNSFKFSKPVTKSTTKSSDGSCLQQRSEMRAARHLAMLIVID